jgi:uncharacterized protein (DUF1330 family)
MTAHDAAHIDPTPEQLEAFVAAAGEKRGPVTMVNLLAFAGEEGRQSYARYGAEVLPHLERVGASVVYAGEAGGVLIGAEPWWDAILVVRYPSRSAFLEMVLDPAYQEIAVHRSNGLRTSALVATDSWG